jgi:hypothetical protein
LRPAPPKRVESGGLEHVVSIVSRWPAYHSESIGAGHRQSRTQHPIGKWWHRVNQVFEVQSIYLRGRVTLALRHSQLPLETTT